MADDQIVLRGDVIVTDDKLRVKDVGGHTHFVSKELVVVSGNTIVTDEELRRCDTPHMRRVLVHLKAMNVESHLAMCLEELGLEVAPR